MSPNSKGEEKKKYNNNNILYIIYILYIFFLFTEEISFSFFCRFLPLAGDFSRVENVVRFSLLHMFFVLFFAFLEILAVLSQIAVKLSNFYA